ncbi:hypothetical protein FI667_g10500, partial [Globisporangium splendens]
MGNRRRFSQMLTVSDGYWGFVNKLRFYRWAYAAMTLFAMFAVVVAFFDIGAGTSYAPNFLKDKPNLTTTQLDENERLLQWLYYFVPTPLALAWFLVYFGKFFFCWKIKRLRKARNYHYNLLLASIVSAILYAVFIADVLKMGLNDGPKLRSALVTAMCEFGLIFIEVFDERETRKKRHHLKRLLKERQANGSVQTTAEVVHSPGDLELQRTARVPGGML